MDDADAALEEDRFHGLYELGRGGVDMSLLERWDSARRKTAFHSSMFVVQYFA